MSKFKSKLKLLPGVGIDKQPNNFHKNDDDDNDDDDGNGDNDDVNSVF